MTDFAPGLYFDLDEDAYHAVPALSSTGIKHLKASSMDFWVRSWLNANRTDEDTDAKRLGKAYHKRVVEGHEAFERAYSTELTMADHPNAIRTMDQMKDVLRKNGLQWKTSDRRGDLIKRIRNYPKTGKTIFWDDLVEDHQRRNHGKIMIPADWTAEIELRAAMVERHPHLSLCFQQGRSEVSIMWVDEDCGVPMKCRMDYLKTRAVVDLKTFSNKHGRAVDRAIATEIANYRYHIQVAVYLEGAAQIPKLVADGAVHGDVDPEWLEQVAAHDKQFVFVFQQTGIAPVARGKVFQRGNVLAVAELEVRDAKQRFRICMDKFGTDPWVDDAEIGQIEDSEIPAYATE